MFLLKPHLLIRGRTKDKDGINFQNEAISGKPLKAEAYLASHWLCEPKAGILAGRGTLPKKTAKATE